MKIVTRKRVVAAAFVVATVGVVAALGAVSKPSATTTTGTTAGTPGVPSALWYWTMAVSPKDPNVLVVATSSGLYRSSDGGKTWGPVGPKSFNATSLVQVGDSLLAGGVKGGGLTSSPVVRKGTARAAADGTGIVATSADDGATWKQVHPKGLPATTVQALAVDPADAKNVYALLNSGKLYRSTDGASSFTITTSKIGIPPWAIAIAQGNLFLGGDMDTGGYTSGNTTTWKRTSFIDSSGGHMVMEYAVQPGDLTRVIMSSRGIELSTDGGKSWHLALNSSTMFGPVAWSPSSSQVAYAVGFDSSVWRTDNGGKSWTKVP